MSVEPMKMTMLQQHLKRVAEHKKFKESLTPSEQMDYETFGKEYVLRGRDPADKAKRDVEMEEKRREAREEREEKVYGKELRITGKENEDELVKKVKARAQKDDEEYRAEKEKEKKLMEERKANRMKQMEANWKVYMTVKEMMALLKENGKTGYSGKKKDELIAMIEKHGLKGEKKEEPKKEEKKDSEDEMIKDDKPMKENKANDIVLKFSEEAGGINTSGLVGFVDPISSKYKKSIRDVKNAKKFATDTLKKLFPTATKIDDLVMNSFIKPAQVDGGIRIYQKGDTIKGELIYDEVEKSDRYKVEDIVNSLLKD